MWCREWCDVHPQKRILFFLKMYTTRSNMIKKRVKWKGCRRGIIRSWIDRHHDDVSDAGGVCSPLASFVKQKEMDGWNQILFSSSFHSISLFLCPKIQIEFLYLKKCIRRGKKSRTESGVNRYKNTEIQILLESTWLLLFKSRRSGEGEGSKRWNPQQKERRSGEEEILPQKTSWGCKLG